VQWRTDPQTTRDDHRSALVWGHAIDESTDWNIAMEHSNRQNPVFAVVLLARYLTIACTGQPVSPPSKAAKLARWRKGLPCALR
jgi:hypothetical protein